jgi:predicted ATP-binding protein involved in virulence
LLKKVLFRTESLVPGIVDLELRGRRSDLMTSHRFVQRAGSENLKLSATWLSHGYQSVLAWVSDLVGQIMLEAGPELEPEEMEGLVLIDEIDLYLHPSWQVGLVQALRETFPEMQFVVTTHSPILLTAFRREEVVVLDFLAVKLAAELSGEGIAPGVPLSPQRRRSVGT